MAYEPFKNSENLRTFVCLLFVVLFLWKRSQKYPILWRIQMNVHVHKLCRFYPPEFWAHAATAHPTDVRRKIFIVCWINMIKYGCWRYDCRNFHRSQTHVMNHLRMPSIIDTSAPWPAMKNSLDGHPLQGLRRGSMPLDKAMLRVRALENRWR